MEQQTQFAISRNLQLTLIPTTYFKIEFRITSMATVRKALPEDFEKTYPLLEKLNNTTLKRIDWEKLFKNPWNDLEEHCGYLLIEADKIVGFLGTLFNSRKSQGQNYNFCNVTSWIVEKEYRNQSFLLLLPLLSLKKYNITIFSPSEATYLASKKLGFQDFETHKRLITPIPTIKGFFEDCSIENKNTSIEKSLDKNYLKIFLDHQSSNCAHLLITTKFGTLYMIATRVKKKNVPVAQIHFISDLNIFSKSINIIKLKIFFKLKVFLLLIDERFVKGMDIPCSIPLKLPFPRVLKSGSLNGENIDSLYSELIILNL